MKPEIKIVRCRRRLTPLVGEKIMGKHQTRSEFAELRITEILEGNGFMRLPEITRAIGYHKTFIKPIMKRMIKRGQLEARGDGSVRLSNDTNESFERSKQ